MWKMLVDGKRKDSDLDGGICELGGLDLGSEVIWLVGG